MSAAAAPRIAVCIVTFNSAELIRDLAASLPAGCEGTQWSVVVADNASSDDTLSEVARWMPAATIVETGANRGFGAGVNRAIEAAGDQDGYLILNADVRLGRGCVATLAASLSREVGIVVPRLTDAEGRLIWSQRREPTLVRAWADALIGAERAGRRPLLGEVVTDPRLYEAPRVTDWAEGSTQLVGAECLRRCGPWDESFFLYSEETEFDLRARDHGLRTLYQPAATAQHLEGGSAGSPRLWSLLVANRVALYGARHGRAATATFWLATVAREGGRALLGKPTSRAALRDLVSPRRMRQRRGPAWLDDVRV